jgi:hypothetical protein
MDALKKSVARAQAEEKRAVEARPPKKVAPSAPIKALSKRRKSS